MTLTKNIVTDYECPTDGTSDCRAAFLAFRSDAQAKTAILTVPPGRYNFTMPVTNDEFDLFKGISDLTVNMAGATFLDNAGDGGYNLGADVNYGAAGTTARLGSVSAGALSVTCKTPAHAGIFTAGRYALLTGLDMQGLWPTSYGFPINHHFFEYVKVAAVDNTTGVVTFTDPIRHSYLDSWPHYAPGEYPDQGGPATLYALHPSWDCSLKFNGGIFGLTNGTTNCAGREIIFTNYVQSAAGVNPSINGSIRFIDSTLDFVEVDKLIGTFSLEGATTAKQINFQSSSVDLCRLTGAVTVDNLNGTPKQVMAGPGTIIGSLTVGCVYGRTEELYFDNCIIKSVTMPGAHSRKGPYPSEAGWQDHAMSNGIITIPNSANAIDWAIPGAWCYWEGAYETETAFRVLGVTQDAGNIYVQTSMPGGFPGVPRTGSGALWIRPHPAPKAGFINCRGCAEVVDWSQAGTRPFASYSKRTYDKNAMPAAYYYVVGEVESISFNVTTAFTGQGPLTLHLSQFDNCKTLGLAPSYTVADYGPVIDLRQAGNRVITPSEVTGAQSGDANLTLPDAQTWLTGIISPFVSRDVGADPSNFSVTIEVITSDGQGQGMASDFILIDTTTTTATQAHLLKQYVSTLRQAYELGTRVKDIMLHTHDGTNFADLEKLFGVPAGQGQAIFDLINGSVGSMQGDFQVDDAKEITERVV